MTRLRLLPLVVVAASALLLLKGLGLVTEGRFALTGAAPAAAAGGGHGEPAAAEPDHEVGHPGARALADPPALATERPAEAPPPLPISDAEREILEQLQQRRQVLDARQTELADRQALLEAAERRIEERIAELRALEAELRDTATAKEAEADAQLLSVVAMYEAMRPRDAAAIFEDMDLTVLVELARHIKPRTLAVIMGGMSPASAQRLTVELATNGSGAPAVPDFADLPKIGETIGVPAPAP